MQKKERLNNFFLSPVLPLFIIGILIFLPNYDFWDGRIISHAFEKGDLTGVDFWFSSSGWHLQLILIKFAYYIQSNSFISGIFLLKLISFFSLIALVNESIKIGKKIYQFSESESRLFGMIVAVFPAWSTLLSSVLFIYIFCTWLVFFGVRLIMNSKSILKRNIGYILTTLSFQLNSNFLFSIGLGFSFYLISIGLSKKFNNLEKKSRFRFFGIIILSFSSYVILRLYFVSYGLYEDYNQISIINLFKSILLSEKFGFASFPLFIFLSIILTLLIYRNNFLLRNFKIDKQKIIFSPLTHGFILLIFSSLPYLLVGKNTSIFAISDWSQRHSFLLSIPIALILFGLGRLINDLSIRSLNNKKLVIMPTILILFCLLMSGFFIKLSRASYEAGIINKLSAKNIPQPGTLNIETDYKINPGMRFYEVNWLLYQAFNEEFWYSNINKNYLNYKEDNLLKLIKSNQIYKNKYIMRNFSEECNTTIKVKGENKIKDIFKWILFRKPPNKFSAIIQSNC